MTVPDLRNAIVATAIELVVLDRANDAQEPYNAAHDRLAELVDELCGGHADAFTLLGMQAAEAVRRERGE